MRNKIVKKCRKGFIALLAGMLTVGLLNVANMKALSNQADLITKESLNASDVVSISDFRYAFYELLPEAINSIADVIDTADPISKIEVCNPILDSYSPTVDSDTEGSNRILIPIYTNGDLTTIGIITKFNEQISITIRSSKDYQNNFTFRKHWDKDSDVDYISVDQANFTKSYNVDKQDDGTDFEYTENAELYDITALYTAEHQISITAALPTTKTLSYSIKQTIASNPNSVWAAVLASMIAYERPTVYPNITAKQIMDYMGVGYNTYLPVTSIPNVLYSYLPSPYLPTMVYSPLTFDQIRTVINNNDPAYMNCFALSGGKNSAASLIGYKNISGGLTICVGDSFTGSKISVTSSSYTNMTLDLNGSTYVWDTTVRLLYRN